MTSPASAFRGVGAGAGVKTPGAGGGTGNGTMTLGRKTGRMSMPPTASPVGQIQIARRVSGAGTAGTGTTGETPSKSNTTTTSGGRRVRPRTSLGNNSPAPSATSTPREGAPMPTPTTPITAPGSRLLQGTASSRAKAAAAQAAMIKAGSGSGSPGKVRPKRVSKGPVAVQAKGVATLERAKGDSGSPKDAGPPEVPESGVAARNEQVSDTTDHRSGSSDPSALSPVANGAETSAIGAPNVGMGTEPEANTAAARDPSADPLKSEVGSREDKDDAATEPMNGHSTVSENASHDDIDEADWDCQLYTAPSPTPQLRKRGSKA